MGRALSFNGLNWEIEVKSDRTPTLWGSLPQPSETAYFRYGLWSASEGLATRSYASHYDNNGLRPRADEVVAAVQASLSQLPFALADSHELWLLDQEQGLPLALIAAVRPEQSRPKPEPRRWSACLSSDIPSQPSYPNGDALTALVKARVGFNIRKEWIERHSDGSGTVLRTQTRLAAEHLSPLLLSRHWPEASQPLVENYFNWIAPVLLTLPHLSAELRGHLEQQLHRCAATIEHHWRLYPTMIEPQLITSARVQSRLQP